MLQNNRASSGGFLKISLLLLIVGIAACRQSDSYEMQLNGRAQGSTYHITYLYSAQRKLQAPVDSVLQAVDASVNTYDSTSLISQLNQAKKVKTDAIFDTLWQRSRQIHRRTQGYFDPTVGPIVKFWGFGPKERKVADSSKVDSMLQYVGLQKVDFSGGLVHLPKGYYLDFNSIAQGYTVDLVAQALEKRGIKNYLVEIGGEVRTKGQNAQGKKWRLGIDKPTEKIDNQNRFQAIIALEDEALATSGNYRKYWVDTASGVKYAHTINPHSGFPSRNTLLSVSVIAPTGLIADAYATAFMAMGLRKSLKVLALNKSLKAYLIVSHPEKNWEVVMQNGFEDHIINKLKK